jgi:hypothetical protein
LEHPVEKAEGQSNVGLVVNVAPNDSKCNMPRPIGGSLLEVHIDTKAFHGERSHSVACGFRPPAQHHRRLKRLRYRFSEWGQTAHGCILHRSTPPWLLELHYAMRYDAISGIIIPEFGSWFAASD